MNEYSKSGRSTEPPIQHDFKVLLLPNLDEKEDRIVEYEEEDEENKQVKKKRKKTNTGIFPYIALSVTEWILACPVKLTDNPNIKDCTCKILALECGTKNVTHIASITFVGLDKPPSRVKNLFSNKKNERYVQYIWPSLFIKSVILEEFLPDLGHKIYFNHRLAVHKTNVVKTEAFNLSNLLSFQMWYIKLAFLDTNVNLQLANTLINCWIDDQKIPESTTIHEPQTNQFGVIKYFLTNLRVANDLGTLININQKIIANIKYNWATVNDASKINGTESNGEFESDYFLNQLNVPFINLSSIFLDGEDFLNQCKNHYKKIVDMLFGKFRKSVKTIKTPRELKYKQVEEENVPGKFFGFKELPVGSSDNIKYNMEMRYDLLTRRALDYCNPIIRKPAYENSKFASQNCILFNVYHFDNPFQYRKKNNVEIKENYKKNQYYISYDYKKMVDLTIEKDYQQAYKLTEIIQQNLIAVSRGSEKIPTYNFHEVISRNRVIYSICIDLDIKNTNVIQGMKSEKIEKRVQLFEIIKNAVEFVCSTCMKLPVENLKYCLYETIPTKNNKNKIGFHFIFRYKEYCFLNTEVVHKILIAINLYLVKKHLDFFGSHNFVDMEIYKRKYHSMRLGLNFKPDRSEGVLLPVFSNTTMSMLPSFSISHISRDLHPDNYMIIDVCDIHHETNEIYKLHSINSASSYSSSSSSNNHSYNTNDILKVLESITSKDTKKWKIRKKSCGKYSIIPNEHTCTHPNHDEISQSNSFNYYTVTIITDTDDVEVINHCTCGNKTKLGVHNVNVTVR